MIDVQRAGALTTVQDAGRAGHAHLGVSAAGALDGPALRLANRLVGNHETTAALEITMTGCRLRFRRASDGPRAPQISSGHSPAPQRFAVVERRASGFAALAQG